MTLEEFGEVYEEIRFQGMAALVTQYRLQHADAEDILQKAVVELLKRPELLASMNKHQVVAWLLKSQAGNFGGLAQRVRDYIDSESKRKARERAWAGPYEKNFQVAALFPEKDPEDSILYVRGVRAKVPLISRKGEFTDGVDEAIDRLRPRPRGRPRKNPGPQPAKPKRTYTRKLVGHAA